MAELQSFELVVEISGISANDKETFWELLHTELVALPNVRLIGIEDRDEQKYFVTLRTENVDDLTAKMKIAEQITGVLRGLTTDSTFTVQIVSVKKVLNDWRMSKKSV